MLEPLGNRLKWNTDAILVMNLLEELYINLTTSQALKIKKADKMEYTIISSNTHDQTIQAVQRNIAEGWIVLGGISVAVSRWHIGFSDGGHKKYEDEINFYQAMTRTCKPSKTVKKSGLQPKAVIDLWNEVTKDSPLPRKLKIIAALEQSIRARINERDGFDTLGAWKSYFTAITRSDFLTGQTDRGNWKASLEWAVKPKSIAGVIEGKYHNG